MDVRYFLWAKYADIVGDGTVTVVGACQDVYHATAPLPLALPSLYLASCITLTKDEALRQQHTLRYVILLPDGETLLASDEMIIDFRADLPVERNYVHVNTVLVLFNVLLHQEGYYRLQLVFDQELVKEHKINVEVQAAAASTTGSPGSDGGDQ